MGYACDVPKEVEKYEADPMQKQQVEYLIEKLQEMATSAQKKGENRKWSKLSTHVTELVRWRDGGMKGVCPVDYKSLGIKLPKDDLARRNVDDSEKDVEEKPVEIEQVVEDKMLDSILRENMSRAEELLAKDEFASAISLAEIILNNQKIPDDIRQQVKHLANEARVKREVQIKALLDLAKKAFDDKVWNAAERNYRQALELDEVDQRALEGLNALLSLKSEAEQKAHLQEIKFNLQLLNKIDILANAVREAEQLIARKKADDELFRLYQVGKDRWDELREKQGQTTTKARIGNLESRAEAVHEYEQYIIHNQMTVWDATLNTFIPTDEALKEARRNWEDFSHQETQKRLNEVERNLPHNLDWAMQRLVDAVNQQYYDFEDTEKKNPLGFSFFEHDRADLQARLAEIERLIKNRDQADALRERARAVSPEESLILLMDARNLWEHLEGIDKRIGEQKEIVASLLADRAESKLREAHIAIGLEKFSDAERLIYEAQTLTKQLPGEQPPTLKQLEEKIYQVTKELREIEGAVLEFQTYSKELDRLLDKPELYGVALNLLNEMQKKGVLKKYPRLDAMKSVVSAYYSEGIIKKAVHAVWDKKYDEAMGLFLNSKGINNEIPNYEVREALEVLSTAKLKEAELAAEQANLLQANSILKSILDLHLKFPLPTEIAEALRNYRKEIEMLTSAEKDLKQAKSYLEEGKISNEVEDLLKKILVLKYSSLPASNLKKEAALVLARQLSKNENYDQVEESLRFRAIANPLDTRMLVLLESYKRQKVASRSIKDEIQALHTRAKIWFWASIFTAILLVAVSVFVILTTINKDQPLSALSSLSSIIPVLATKLVYDQSVRADNLANQIYKDRLQSEQELLDKIKDL